MAYPPLTVVRGDAQPHMTGRDLLDELAPIIVEHLPSIPRDDPWRPTFERFLSAARDRSRMSPTPKGGA